MTILNRIEFNGEEGGELEEIKYPSASWL